MVPTRLALNLTTWSLLAVCVMAACTKGYSSEGRPECPGEDPKGVRFVFDSGAGGITVTHVPLSEPVTNIPEYHDCQNFITPQMKYDSLFAIFAAFRLHNKLAPDTIGASSDSVLFHGTKLAAVAAATVFSASKQTYAPLGIQPGFNCLFVFHPPADTSRWFAKMVPLTPPDSNCTRPGMDLTAGTVLLVKPSKMPNAGLNDYPQAARWDWDATTKTQYIGIACRENWCDIGDPAGFQQAPPTNTAVTFAPIPGMTLSSVESKRVFMISGWYDRQLLATQTSAGLVPSGVLGITIPNPGLAHIDKNWTAATSGGQPTPYSDMTPYQDQWVNVSATIVTAPYKDLRVGAPNMVYFCYGTQASCAIPSQHATPRQWTPTDKCKTGTSGPKRWFGKLLFQGETVGYGCVTVTDHWNDLNQWKTNNSSDWTIALPATARWHWLTTDDAAGWQGCYQTSCCKN